MLSRYTGRLLSSVYSLMLQIKDSVSIIEGLSPICILWCFLPKILEIIRYFFGSNCNKSSSRGLFAKVLRNKATIEDKIRKIKTEISINSSKKENFFT